MVKHNGNRPTPSKEISWLEFNDRVLDEATDSTVPLLERFKFLGIYSNNLDEFFRVRVATLNRLANAPQKETVELIGQPPKRILKLIQKTVVEQQKKFDRIFRRLLRELAEEKIFFVDERQLTKTQADFVTDYFNRVVRPKLFPIMIDGSRKFPELKDKSIYLAVQLIRHRRVEKTHYALIEVPTDDLSRFVILPESRGKRYIMMLDDVIRYNLEAIFSSVGYSRYRAYTIKLTRDAELDIDNDLFESYIRKVHKSLRQRKEGDPVRLVYDSEMPDDLYRLIVKRLDLDQTDPVIAGGRYHNFKDFMNFPNVGRKKLHEPHITPMPHPYLAGEKSLLHAIAQKDVLLHFPYHSFDHITDLLREASLDPNVKAIKITLYRTAQNSSIVNALMNAVKNGKSVVAVVELQARFDEEANIYWATELQEAGAKVVFGVVGLKVHSKTCLITRKEGSSVTHFAAVGTGNFNEDTARVYTDHFLLTADQAVSEQIAKIFEFLEKNYKTSTYRNLLVSPFNMRRKLSKFIQTEIDHAVQGRPAEILLKLNHLTDELMIRNLYRASQAGVKIRLIVRGMFTLEPGLKDLSENIQAIRLVDMLLEHSRVMFFLNGGEERCFITSGDWMPRNLDRRVEVACPIFDPALKQELKDLCELQWHDNTKSRPLNDPERRRRPRKAESVHRAQLDIYQYLKGKRTGKL